MNPDLSSQYHALLCCLTMLPYYVALHLTSLLLYAPIAAAYSPYSFNSNSIRKGLGVPYTIQLLTWQSLGPYQKIKL